MRFSQLCAAYERIAKTSKRLEKTAIIAELLKEADDAEMQDVMMLLKGRVYPEWEKTQIGISSKLATKAICLATGESEEKVIKAFKKSGDLGEVTAQLLSKKKQHSLLAKEDLTIHDVVKSVRKLSGIEGHGSVDLKLKTIANLMSSATPTEAHYLVRILLEDLRVGVADGTIRDAIIAWASALHEKSDKTDTKNELLEEQKQAWTQAVQNAIDKSNDLAKVAVSAKHKGIKGLESIELTVGVPIKVMLAQKELEIPAGFERVGRPGALEYKYDGFRMQLHRDKEGTITLFTRRLENVTAQFPDVVARLGANIKKSCILDAEAVGYDPKTGKYTPFQAVSQRIRRKYDIEQLSKELPIEVNVFDILYYDGEQVYLKPFQERRKLIERIVPHKVKEIKTSELLITSDDKEAAAFYKKSLDAGNEGIMFKALDAPYKPGSRVGFMVKMKPVLDTLDVVIVGAEWGEGKRSGWLTSFTVACQDEDGNFVELGRVGTGLKELEQEGGTTFEQLTKLLKEDIISEKGKEVVLRPNIVIELKFEEIQKSPSYSSGFALRFPRFVQLRDDRRPDEISTLADVIDAFEAQRGRNK
jgi:DNA ligase-1